MRVLDALALCERAARVVEGKPLLREPCRACTPSASCCASGWRRTAATVETDWVNEMKGKNIDGAKLLSEARALIAKYQR